MPGLWEYGGLVGGAEKDAPIRGRDASGDVKIELHPDGRIVPATPAEIDDNDSDADRIDALVAALDAIGLISQIDTGE